MPGGGKPKNIEALVEPQVGMAEWVGPQGVAGEQLDWARGSRAARERAYAPVAAFAEQAATGDPAALTRAAGPWLRQIGEQYATAGETIRSNVPRGVGQEFALANLEREKAGQTAETFGQVFLKGLELSQGIGRDYGQFSLQETGAGLTGVGLAQQGYRGAAQTQATAEEMRARKKEATIGFLGDLVEAGGSAAGGALGKPG